MSMRLRSAHPSTPQATLAAFLALASAIALALAPSDSRGQDDAPGGPREWHVNPESGSDENDGSAQAPLATAQTAIDRAGPGDIVQLHPEGAVYRQSVELDGLRDLIIEGNGVTLSGADALDPEGWEDLGDGLHRRRLPRPKFDRHYLIVRGKPQRMGRSVAEPPSFPPAAELRPGQFRWDDIDAESGWLTYRGDLEGLEWGVRANGFAAKGAAGNVRVYRLAAAHFLNDGFQTGGRSRGLQFFHISAIGNFAGGFKALGESSCWIHHGRFLGNGYAAADVESSDTYYTECVFGDSFEVEVLFHGGRHSLTRCRILAGERSLPIQIRSTPEPRSGGAEASHATLVLQDVEIDSSQSLRLEMQVGPGASVYYDAETAPHIETLEANVHPNSRLSADLYRLFPIGRDGAGQPIMAWAAAGSLVPKTGNYRVIHFDRHRPEGTVPEISPNNDWFGLTAPLPTGDFPPRGDAFTAENEAAHAIWRWIGLTAPDAVFLPDNAEGRALGAALQKEFPAGVGRVDLFISKPAEDGTVQTTLLPPADQETRLAKEEMLARLARSPEELATQMAAHYGNSFDGGYLDGVAIMAKLRAGLPNDAAALALEKADSPLPTSAGQLSGTLLYAELALRDEAARPWAGERVARVADLAFAEDGSPLPSMPHHGEMSDAIFMSGPLLALAGELTGDGRYHDQAVRHTRFVQAMCLREDGLYRHSPLHEAAWGRGNGFPALGITMMLDHFPEDHPERAFLEESLLAHLEALAPHQNIDGLWHQIIDHDDSYAEFTVTCMVAYAILRGIRTGRLDEATWSPRLRSAWNAVKARVDTDGKTLINVCTGTGKQRSLEDYYRRTAIFGRDPRGGGLAMLLAAEMMEWGAAAGE